MVSDITELARTLRSSASRSRSESASQLRSTIRANRREITHQLNQSGRAVFTDDSGNQFLIEREMPER